MSVNKRLLKEVTRLIKEQNTKPLLDNDYLISFDERNMNKIYSIIKAPYDSVYRHKFIRLNFDIPEDYPHSPPTVTFVNYDGVRIHPNMYEDGKCCSTILNTWPSENEKWTSSMGIETILLMFHSFLDNDPYTYEPGGRDDPSYTEYVLFQSWKTCLIRYIDDRLQPDIFITFINNYLLINIESIFNDLLTLVQEYPYGNRYTHCFEIEHYIINYDLIISRLEQYYEYVTFKDTDNYNDTDNYDNEIGSEIDGEIEGDDVKCAICFDHIELITLSCNHTFHIDCLQEHIKNNGEICSLCRTCLTESDLTLTKLTETNTWIINPQTKRRVKIGSKTYQRLKIEGVI